jgi:hypothetical protein
MYTFTSNAMWGKNMDRVKRKGAGNVKEMGRKRKDKEKVELKRIK